MANGKVKWFDAAKKFGFIVPDDNSGDIFVHISSVPLDYELQEGNRVSYDVAQRKGKSCAVNVRVTE